MNKRSHVDTNKIEKLPVGQQFEYRDVVEDDFPNSKHPEDGSLFNREVENGLYENVVISNEDTEARVKYRKV